ncbi:MAG: amidohydrolase family protein [Chloroflexota bacterium]
MILDFHTHVDHAEVYGWFDPPEKLLALMDDAGIERAAIMTYLDHPLGGADPIATIHDAITRYPERLIGFVRLNPNFRAEARRALDRCVLELGFRGVKLHPTTTLAHPAGDATIELLERCAELGVPALFHCGDDPYTTPQALEAAAARVPGCTVVLGHMGGYFHAEDAIAAAVRQPNLVLETSAMPYPERIADAVRAVGPWRVVYGSDGPGCNPALEVEKVRLAGLPAEDEAIVLGRAGARILGLPEDDR